MAGGYTRVCKARNVFMQETVSVIKFPDPMFCKRYRYITFGTILTINENGPRMYCMYKHVCM